MAYRTMGHLTFGDSWCLGAFPPNHVSSLPAPSLSGKKLFQPMDLYAASSVVAHNLNLLAIHKPYAVVDEAGCS